VNDGRPLLLDACSLINLVASELQLSTFARTIERDFIVTTIAAEESLFVSGRSVDDPAEPVSVEALAASGQLTIVALTPDELGRFIYLAKSVDDGEASTLAVARERGIEVATDDRRAIRVAGELGVTILTTPQLMRDWAERSGATAVDISAAVTNVEQRGNFSPRRDDPEHPWWTANRIVGT
jgi:predicted nucleic acid-binding protein